MLKKTSIVLFIIFFLSFGIFFLKAFQKASNERLKKETFVKHLNYKKLKTKLKKTPKWMHDQIREDFAPFISTSISKNKVDETYKTIRKNYPHPAIIRYRILNNELYRFFEKKETKNEYTSIEKAINTLLYFFSFKDMDFILSYNDGIYLFDQPKDFYCTSKELQAPILCSAKSKDAPYVITIPDWRSLDIWWVNEIKKVLQASKKNSWKNKENFGFWRGSLTNKIRYKLCKISLSNPKYLDARINAKLETKELQAILEKEGIYSDLCWTDWDKILKYKYLPLVNGVMTASPAFQSRLLSNSLTFKQEFDGSQWFFKALKPFVHYVPIKNDLSDLIEMFKWAKAHDEECQKIAENSTQWALNNLMFEDVYLYFYLVLKQYSSLQNLNKKEILNEMLSSPNWIKIQNREDFKKNLKCKLKKHVKKIRFCSN